jgi:hypothetical protein
MDEDEAWSQKMHFDFERFYEDEWPAKRGSYVPDAV